MRVLPDTPIWSAAFRKVKDVAESMGTLLPAKLAEPLGCPRVGWVDARGDRVLMGRLVALPECL